MPTLRPYQAEIVEQIRKAWENGYRSPCVVLGCGGGKSCIVAEIARRTTKNGKQVLFIVHRVELVDQITKTFIEWGVDMTLCQIGMVQTFCRHLSTLKIPSLIITDENHHCLAESYKKIYKYFDTVPKIGVTATPIRLNGDGLGDINDFLVIGKSTKWLIANRYLAPYKYFSPTVDDLKGIRTRNGDFIAADIGKKLIKKAIFGNVISYYKKLADGKKAICYCATVEHSNRMKESFIENGIRAEHIDGSTPSKERERIIEDFRNGTIDILCNVDLISEGFDVPDCECVILLRPTKSLTLYIQQSMRCMRYKPDKTAIIIDHVGNYARHGLPDQDRTWTLDKIDHSKNAQPKVSIGVRQCPNCFLTIESSVSQCPNCGYAFPNPREVKEVTGELQQISGVTLDFSTPESCKSYKELLIYAKKHGYKSGWAYYQAKNRGFIL